MYLSSFNSHDNFERLALSSLFYEWGNWSSERWNNSPKSTQLDGNDWCAVSGIVGMVSQCIKSLRGNHEVNEKGIWNKTEAKKKPSEYSLIIDANETKLNLYVKISMKSYEMLNYSTSQKIDLSKLHNKAEKKVWANFFCQVFLRLKVGEGLFNTISNTSTTV